MNTKFKLMILLLGAMVIASCTKYPEDTERLAEDLAIATKVDTQVDFNNYKTYAIAESVIKITDEDTTALNSATATLVLEQFKQNMTARGFQNVTEVSEADLGIAVLYFENTNIYYYYDYYYWGYPGWGYYYPYYPPVYYGSYTVGVMVAELIDLKNPNTGDQKLTIRWSVFIRGLLTESITNTQITNSVDQAFEQTPTLKTN